MEKAQSLAEFLCFLANGGMSMESVVSLRQDLLDGQVVDVKGKNVCLKTLPCCAKP